jgi:hypothetical protein
MKWIGQHIWSFISRFRNDVYLEDISTGTIASGSNLGLDSNNKVVKAELFSLEDAVEAFAASGGGGTGSGEIIDLGDRTSGNEILDIGQRV